MDCYYIHDLKSYLLHKKIVKNLRQLYKNQSNKNLYEIFANTDQLITGNYYCQFDQIWFLGNVLVQLAETFNGCDIKDSDEFVYDTKIILLDQAIDALCLGKNIKITKTDYRVYQEKFKDYLL